MTRNARGNGHLTLVSAPVVELNDGGAQLNSLPGGHYGYGVSYLDEHCRWMLRAGRAERTIKLRRMHMQYLVDFLGRDPVDATERELEAWQDSVPLDQLRNKTAMVRPYYVYIHQRGYRADNPAALLVTPRKKRNLPRPIAFDAMERAILHAPSLRMRAWLILAAYAGMRAKEVAHLERDNIERRPEGGVFIRLTRTKGEYQRVTALPEWAWQMVEPALAPEGCASGASGELAQSHPNRSRSCRMTGSTSPVPGRRFTRCVTGLDHRVSSMKTYGSCRSSLDTQTPQQPLSTRLWLRPG